MNGMCVLRGASCLDPYDAFDSDWSLLRIVRTRRSSNETQLDTNCCCEWPAYVSWCFLFRSIRLIRLVRLRLVSIMHFLNPVYIKRSLLECELLLCMKFVHFVVLLAMPGPLHQGIVAPNCSEVSQLGPGNTHFKCYFLGMSTRKVISVRVRPWAKTYGAPAVRRTGLGQLWSCKFNFW